MKVLELFGGIGACSKALEKLGIDYEIADYVEIDKYAVKSFNAMHNTNFEPQNITTWDKDLDVDLIMHGSPCQDFSLAGLQAGGDKNSGTRSSLMYETIRIVEKLKPKYVIWENVKNLLSKKHIHNFNAYLTKMRLLGYWNYYQVLNAKDYGIPQNRERIFVVSIRGDVNSYGCHISNYIFPEKKELKIKLRDMLENNADEKYYLSEEKINKIIINDPKRVSENMPIVLGGIGEKDSNNNTQWKQQNRIYRDNIALCVSTICNPYYLIKNNTKKGYLIATKGDCIDLSQPNSKTRRGRVQKELTQTITTQNNLAVITEDFKIRKLTPKECWRLMGFDDVDFERAKASGNSDSQLYKQAGNSIVVNVLMAIFKELL